MLALGGGAALAITAQDVTAKMTQEQRFSYLTGLIDMLAFESAQSGNATVQSCLYDAYYRDQHSDAWVALMAAMEKFPDKEPAAIAFLLARKTCGG